MPREAAMHGCCLITGKLGSAGNAIDLPIPPLYKLDSNANGFIEDFGVLAKDVMDKFAGHHAAFTSYRKWLQDEPKIFKQQIADYFCKY
ncbi:hypothetical protein CL55_00002550 [Polynucleobacter duraquae]|uniref:Uncharacterized protein n=1 Tax=Polynucleobacter duraquae TaxID=1835254 RepID=A0A0E3V0H5_9BURK|nr:hypothetical protein [Polynucleobacter duraquae]AKD24588.1 hypothetical protein CL55_00002550 [Polynucleobacter duraquae]